ncbi:rust resistance kinase Lr10-like [Arachis duranensis]|uniref:Rust resistance kinase Lr10-like n=1 Tax=Arachis duranensis TaxID=130453 RepID=A0A6P5MFR5_ARADU|nr:rust resistance kinase Lr10-like [Arachis duranensis]
MTIPVALLLLLLLVNLNLGNCGDHHPVQCPVRLYCKENNILGIHYTTGILELPGFPSSVKLTVRHVNYTSKTLEIFDPKHCLPELFLRLNYSSFYPFRSIKQSLDFDSDLAEPPEPTNVTFFNCSSRDQPHRRRPSDSDEQDRISLTDEQDALSCPIYVAEDYDDVIDSNLLPCTKLFHRVMPVSATRIRSNSMVLVWNETTHNGHGCFVGCNVSNEVPEFETPNAGKLKEGKDYESIILLITVIGGVFFVSTLLGALYHIYGYYRNKGEDQQRVETFLKDYEALNPTRFSYADIKRITKKFKDKLGEGAHGSVYKGKLSNQILVAVKILNNVDRDGKEFINEVGTMAKIHHVNVVRLLGYCADGSHRALVYHFFPNGNLQSFIASSSNKENFLGWIKLHQIALGIARGIEYLHQGCDQRILHFDINPYNVLLDDNFTPKISDFGLAKLCSKNRSTVSMTAARGTLGYMAPEVFSRNFGNVSYKSDIYSYGMLLLEMVGGRKNTNMSQETFQVLYPNWIHNLLEGDDTYIPIDDDGDFKIAKKLAIVGLWCIQWHPVHRPSMKNVVQMLEAEEDKLKVPPNPFESTAATSSSAIIPARFLNLELEVIPETE